MAALMVAMSLVTALAPAPLLTAAGAIPPPPPRPDDVRDGWRPVSEGGRPEDLMAARRLGNDAVPRQDPPREPQPAAEPRRTREVPERRAANSRVFELDDGRLQQELSSAPIHYRDAGGSWQPIDVTVGPSSRPDFAVANETNSFRSYFGSDPGGLVRFEAAEGAVTLGVPGAQPGAPVAEENRVTYADGLGQGIDLGYEITSQSLKESVVVQAPPEGEGDLSFTFDLQVEGLQARQRDDGSIVFERPDGDGGPVLVMPAPFMMDAAEDVESPYGRAWSPDVSQALSDDGRSVTLTADGEWLRAEDREFPVVIDPTIRIAPTPTQSQDTMIMRESPTSTFDTSWRLSVGTTNWTDPVTGEAGAVRSLVRFPLDDIPAGARIDSAQLQLWYDQFHTSNGSDLTLEAHAATGPWDAIDATWQSASGLVGDLGNYSVQVDDAGWFTGQTGSWPYSTNPSYTQHGVENDYAYNSGAATGDTYTWYPCFNESGDYRVDAHYVSSSDRATAAPYTVNHPGGSSPYTVNQSGSTVEGRWTRLGSGTFAHDAGCFTGNVVLGDVANKVVVADAVRWTKDATAVRPAGDLGSHWDSFSVQNLVQGWVNDPATNHGFVVKAADESVAGVGGPRYEGSEYSFGGEADNRPRLVVTYGRPAVDLQPPTVLHATGAELSWSAYADPCGFCPDDDIVEYQVHRSVYQTFTPSESTLVAPVPTGTTAFTDTTADPTPADTGDEDENNDPTFGNAYYYMVAVKTADGQVTPGPTRLVRLPKAGRVTRLYDAAYDTTLSTSKPDQGNDTVFGQPWLYAGNNSSPTSYGVTRTLVRFPTLTGVPSSARVVDAKVRLWNRELVGDGAAVWEMHGLTRDFDEAQASWNRASTATAWTSPGGDFGGTVATKTGFTNDPTRRTFTGTGLNSLVQGWVDNPASNRGVLVKVQNETTPAARAIFLSSEAEEPGLRPQLAVTYMETTPEATYHAPSTPDLVEADSTTAIPVTVTNTTGTDWGASWALSYRWTQPDGTVVPATQLQTDVPAMAVGQSVTVTADVQAPPPSSEGNDRTAYTLEWDLYDTVNQAWLSAPGANTVGALKQSMAVEDSTSDQVGLEAFYAYAGKNTGAGSTLMNNLHAGNAVWSYDILGNPSRGLSTFLRLAYNSKDTSGSVAGYGWSLQASSVMRLGVPLDPHPNPGADTVSLTDGDGTTHQWTWDDKGTSDPADDEYRHPAGVHLRLERLVECQPNHLQDPSSRAWVMTKPDRTEFFFNCAGYVSSIVDKNGNEMRFVYEERRSNNQPTQFLRYIEDATGRRTLTIDYYAKGDDYDYIDDTTWTRQSATNLTSPHIIDRVRQVTDISGRRVTFTYTDKGLLGELVDGADAAQPKQFSFRYDMTQGNKNVKLVSVADPLGHATAISYYSNPEDDPKFRWSTKTITDRLGHPTTFTYTDPDGTPADPDPDDENLSTVVTDAESHTTTFVTDSRGRPTRSTNAKNQTTQLGWDGDNNVTRLTEANGAVTTWSYDPKTGYPLEIRDAEANAAPDPATYPGTTLRYQTDLDGYTADLIEKQSPEGRRWQFGYTLEGDLESVTDPMGTFTPEAGDYTTTYTYDDWGQLQTATDANGNVTHYGDYDANGYPKQIADARQYANGKVTAFEYDVRGLVTAVVDTDGTRTTQTYDEFGRPLESQVPKRQAAGEIIVTPQPVYDANDNVTQAVAPELWVGGVRQGEAGAVSTATYDPADQLVATLAPLDEPTDPERRTTFTYDRVGNLRTTTEPKGNLTPEAGDFTTTNTYDEIYQLVDVINAAGHQLSYRYDNVGNVTHVIDPRKNLTASPDDYTAWTWYDRNHRPVVALDGVSYEVTTYDRDGLVVRQEDKGRNQTHITLDVRGMPAEVRVPHDGSGTGITYRTTRYEYDQVGNRTKVVTPRGTATTAADDFVHETVYDELNRVKEQLTPFDPADARYNSANRTIYDYDDDGHLMRVSAPPSEGQSVRNDTAYTYFDNGAVETSTDPWGIVSAYDYNPLGQQTRNTLSPGGFAPGDALSPNRTMTWDYFGDGKLRSRSDSGVPVGRSVVLADNSDAQLAGGTGTWARTSDGSGYHGYDYATHEAGAGTDTFDWWLDVPQDGNYEVFVRYPQVSGAATNASFKVTHRDNVEATVAVDQTANAGSWVRLGSFPFGQGLGKVTLAQNEQGRVVADAVRLVRDNTGEPDDEAIDYRYDYDPNGNMVGITDARPGARVDQFNVSYTGLNQVAEVTELLAGQPLAVSGFTYDPNGAIESTTHPRSYAEFGYDARNLLSSVTNGVSPTDPAPKVTTYTYTPKGERLGEVKGNGNTVDYGYFHDGALRSQVERKPDDTLVAEHTITYEPNGNRATDVSRTMNADNHADLLETTTAYTYDPLDRLARLERTGDGAGVETYVHDANGNVIAQNGRTFTYDRNRLMTSQIGPYAAGYTYDPFGRMETVRVFGLEQERYTYDGFDRPTSHRAGDRTTTYTYDPLDRTTTKTTQAGTAAEETTTFNYLGLSGEVLDEQDTAGTVTRSYQYSPWGERLSQVTHNPDGSSEDGYYGYNPHTDVETVTDEAGNTEATYGYTAYGNNNTALFTGVDAPTAGDPTAEPYNVYRFNAKRWDQASSGYDMGFRNYNPGLNRFLTRDMYNGALADLNLGTSPYTANRYAFGGGNPITNIELDGHEPRPQQWSTTWGDPGVDGYGTSAATAADIASRELAMEVFPGGDMRLHTVDDDVAELFPLGKANMPCFPTPETFGHPLEACEAARNILESDRAAGLPEAMAAYNSTITRTGREDVERDSLMLTLIGGLVTARLYGGRTGGGGPSAPGYWDTVNESMSARSSAYQAQITGRGAGNAYIVDGVKFDGISGNNLLLDAKGPGYSTFVRNGSFQPFFRGTERLVSQAQRQTNAAAGIPIQWSVAEADAATAIRNLLEQRGISGINVVHVPAR